MNTNAKVMSAVVHSAVAADPSQASLNLALFDENGDPLDLAGVELQTGADVYLTDYETGTAAAVEATDSVNEAIAKLEARIAELELEP